MKGPQISSILKLTQLDHNSKQLQKFARFFVHAWTKNVLQF